MTCDYCQSSLLEGVLNCVNCGAPVVHEPYGLLDYRSCPTCHRKLLALASPACSYCGRRLPDEYIKAREADLKRITRIDGGECRSELGSEVSEFFSERGRRKRNEPAGAIGLVDITTLIDFFS